MAKECFLCVSKNSSPGLAFIRNGSNGFIRFFLFSLLIFILIAGSIQIRMLGNIKSELQVYSLDITTGGRSTKKSLIFDRFANSSLFKHYWSLAVELQFYLVFPLFFLTVMRLSRKEAISLCIFLPLFRFSPVCYRRFLSLITIPLLDFIRL